MGGFDNGAITGNVRHRAQGIQRLRPWDTRHWIHGHYRDLTCGQLWQQVGILCGPDKTDQRAARTRQRNLFVIRRIHLQHDIGLPDLLSVAECGTGCDIAFIIEAGAFTGVMLKGDAETQLDELFHGLRRGGHARLVWQPFLGYSN